MIEDDLSITSIADGSVTKNTGVAASELQQFSELDRQNRFRPWKRNEINCRFEHDAERASDPTINFERLNGAPFGELVEVVTADPPQNSRKTPRALNRRVRLRAAARAVHSPSSPSRAHIASSSAGVKDETVQRLPFESTTSARARDSIVLP